MTDKEFIHLPEFAYLGLHKTFQIKIGNFYIIQKCMECPYLVLFNHTLRY